VGYLARWFPARALQWLLSSPNSPSPKEQEQTLLLEVRIATNAKQAAVALLSSRQQSHNPALQTAASDLVPMGESLGSESPDRTRTWNGSQSYPRGVKALYPLVLIARTQISLFRSECRRKMGGGNVQE
jgi:hypothetical protein